MQLIWYGTASLILREGDAAIAFDPFCGIPMDGAADKECEMPCEMELRAITDVFITHGHFDHIYHIPKIYRDVPLRLRCTKTPEKMLIKSGIPKDRIREIAPGWSETVGPFTVKAFHGRHCRFDLPLIFRTVFQGRFLAHLPHAIYLLYLNIRYKENDEILFYEVTCGGKRLQMMGSLNLDPNEAYPTGADVLVLPFQGRSDLEEYGLSLVQRLKPKAVFLDHYDDAFSPLSDTIETCKFIKILREREEIPCHALVKGERTAC